VGLYVVADGMGGHAAGEVASATAVQSIYEHIFAANMTHISNPLFASDVAAVVQCIDDAIQHANTQIMVEAKRLGNDMGTTLTMALVLGDVAYIANIGDSRTYIIRDDQLRRVTNDHSLVMKLVELEHIAEDDIYTHPQRNGVLRSLGVSALAEVDIYIERLRPNDVLVLCSDGLWEMVRDLDIAAILRRGGTVDGMTKALQATANSAGGDDNISVILVRCES
jgi:protein phosphatase